MKAVYFGTGHKEKRVKFVPATQRQNQKDVPED